MKSATFIVIVVHLRGWLNINGDMQNTHTGDSASINSHVQFISVQNIKMLTMCRIRKGL